MKRFWTRLNPLSGAFFGAVLLPIFSTACLKILQLLLELAGSSGAALPTLNDNNTAIVMLFSHFFAGAVLGGVTGAVARLLAYSRRSYARDVCLWPGGLLLFLQISIVSICWRSLMMMRLPSQIRPFLFVSVLFGAPLLWTLALII